MVYEYDCETDAYILKKEQRVNLVEKFFREATKESLLRKYESEKE